MLGGLGWAWGVLITVKNGEQETKVNVPPGSEVTIKDNGAVDVKLPPTPAAALSATPSATFTLGQDNLGHAFDQIMERATQDNGIQWGDEVRGLQIGLSFDPQRPVYHRGDAVRLRLFARNRSDKPLTLVDWVSRNHGRDEASLTSRVPTVQDASGKKLGVAEPDLNTSVGPRKTELLSGKTMLVGAIVFGIGVQPGDPWGVWADLKPGSYQVSQVYSFEETDETTWSGALTTGKLTLTVATDAAAGNLSFGPLIEHVISQNDADGQGFVFFSFRSGKPVKPPAALILREVRGPNALAEPTPELNEWITANGVDLLFRIRAGQWDIQPLNMKRGDSVPKTLWERNRRARRD